MPPDEAQRLRALRSLHILDTPPEERFDRLARMAKRMFDVPIALVSLVDANRQWFKSCVGLEVRETGRDVSFCGHAILGNEVLIIPDATQDLRFCDNPLVLGEPGIRFYAGCPLRALDGSHLGTLCIIDRKPRNLSADDIESFKDLAAMAERELAAIELATVDELTGMTNRRGFLLLAQHSLNLCARQGLPASLLYMDLNNFKPINDRFGHAEGDRALCAFAAQLQRHLRDSDLCARLGGDEFVVLLANTPQASASAVAEKLRRALGQFNRQSATGYEIDCSCGIVEFDPARHRLVESLLADGDALMYECKRQRRNQAAGEP